MPTLLYAVAKLGHVEQALRAHEPVHEEGDDCRVLVSLVVESRPPAAKNGVDTNVFQIVDVGRFDTVQVEMRWKVRS